MSITIQTYIIELEKKEKEYSEKLKKIRNAINSAQNICEHDFKTIYAGPKDFEECKICKKRV